MHRSVIAVSLLLVACGDDGSSAPIDATSDGPPSDVAPGDASGLATTCTGACATTNASAVFGATTRVFDLAYYGVTTTGTAQTLYVEAYRGMAPGCPEMSSPPPEYQLILGRVPVPSATTAVTSPGNILDYEGDLLGGPVGAPATTVTITPVAANAPTSATGMIALDVQLTFANGTVNGHVYATHCTSMDATE